VGRLAPRTGSAVPMSRAPRGAQYCPVLVISNVSAHSTKLLAATSGVTACRFYVSIASVKTGAIERLTTTGVVVLAEPNVGSLVKSA
jgi:hypothetical protein